MVAEEVMAVRRHDVYIYISSIRLSLGMVSAQNRFSIFAMLDEDDFFSDHFFSTIQSYFERQTLLNADIRHKGQCEKNVTKTEADKESVP